MALSANQMCDLRNPTQERTFPFVFANKKKPADKLMSEMQQLVFRKILFVFPEHQTNYSFLLRRSKTLACQKHFEQMLTLNHVLQIDFCWLISEQQKFRIFIQKRIEPVYPDDWNKFTLFDNSLESIFEKPKTILDSWLTAYKCKDVNLEINWRNIACSLGFSSEKKQSCENFLVSSIHEGSNAKTPIHDIVAEDI